jgi:hypothetical protein
MKSSFEQSGGTYHEVNGYFLPNIDLPEAETRPIGRWGRLHETYLEEHRPNTYITLLTTCKLDSYLADISEQATDMLEQLVSQMKKEEGITEQLKAEHQLEWVQRMNSIRNRAEEIVFAELIYR